MTPPIQSVVFPIAGLGTRILPATKAIPKEMLTVVDRPLIEYAVDEARSAGIENFIFVAASPESVVFDHFSRNPELEAVLESRGKHDQLSSIQQNTVDPNHLFCAIQDAPLGLGHAVWCAREFVGDRPFAVILPDDLVLDENSCMKQMVEAYCDIGGNILAVEEVPWDRISLYGIVQSNDSHGNLIPVNGVVEKPEPQDAPSNLGAIGRYILSSGVFSYLSQQIKGAGDEIQLTDAINELVATEPVHGLRFSGTRYDCGNKAGYVAANFAYARRDRSLSEEVEKLVDSMT